MPSRVILIRDSKPEEGCLLVVVVLGHYIRDLNCWLIVVVLSLEESLPSRDTPFWTSLNQFPISTHQKGLREGGSGEEEHISKSRGDIMDLHLENSIKVCS